MSNFNDRPDEKLDFNMDEFSGNNSLEGSSDSTNTSGGNCSTTNGTTPKLVSPPPSSAASGKAKLGEAGKTKSQLFSGSLEVVSANGEKTTVDELHKNMQVGDTLAIHCISDTHPDCNPSSVVRKHESGDIQFFCSSCGFNQFYRGDKPSKTTKKNKDKEEDLSTEEIVLAIADDFHLFRDKQGNTYAETTLHGQKNVIPVMSGDFADTIRVTLYDQTKSTISPHALSNAISTINARIKYGKNVEDVALRNHKYDDCLYINVGDHTRRVIRVNKDGYGYVTDYKGKFITTSRMQSLPDIASKGDITLLKNHLNINDEELPLVYGWLLSTVAGVSPYLFLNIQGVAGSSKSVTAKALQSLVDPTVSFSGAIANINDFALACANGYVVVQDNLSKVSRALADAMCIASTGGTHAKRQLYTNNDTCITQMHNPMIITNINSIANRGDLIERSVILDLPPMPKLQRKDEGDFWHAFNEDKSAIFTGILDGIVSGFKYIDRIQLDSKPRMADAAKWITACEQDIGMGGKFMKAFAINQDMASVDGIDASPVGLALKSFMDKRECYKGKVTNLLQELNGIVGPRQALTRDWPATPNALTATLKRLIPNFKSIGIDIGRKESGTRDYVITNSNYKSENRGGSVGMFSGTDEAAVGNTSQIQKADEFMRENPFIDNSRDDDAE